MYRFIFAICIVKRKPPYFKPRYSNDVTILVLSFSEYYLYCISISFFRVMVLFQCQKGLLLLELPNTIEGPSSSILLHTCAQYWCPINPCLCYPIVDIFRYCVKMNKRWIQKVIAVHNALQLCI